MKIYVYEVFNLEFLVCADKLGMSFESGSDCPQASQTCYDTVSQHDFNRVICVICSHF